MNNMLFHGGNATPENSTQIFSQQSLYGLCPRFSYCSAPICPLDQEFQTRIYCRDERICIYAREAVKQNGEANLRRVLPRVMVDLVLSHSSMLKRGTTHYTKRLNKFSKTPSKMFRG